MLENYACFVLSAGRSGTQWLTDYLQRSYSDIVTADHEPALPGFRVRDFHNLPYDRRRVEEITPVRHHFDFIEKALKNGPYIETGWPSSRLVNYAEDRFPGRVRVLQLTRNPVHNAMSLAAQGMHAAPVAENDDALSRELDPAAAGCRWKPDDSDWRSWTPYERCLLQWYELHASAADLRELVGEGNFLQLRSEDLFAGDEAAFSALHAFLKLPKRVSGEAAAGRRVDYYQRYADAVPDWDLILKHRQVVELAEAMGYSFDEVDNRSLKARYGQTWANYIRRRLGTLKKKLHRFGL